MIKLNLGCGNNKLEGFINVDKSGHCNPDVKLDIEYDIWPWDYESVDEIHAAHILEHITDIDYVFKEMYRVCQPDAKITIIVPHPRSEDFLGDFTHVRPITVNSLDLLSKKKNEAWIKDGSANTPLAIIWNVDFEVVNQVAMLEEPWFSQWKSGELSELEVYRAIRSYNSVVKQNEFTLRVNK